MILDQLSNIDLYHFDNPLVRKGLEFLLSPSLASLPLGRTDIDGDRLFAIVQEYSTKPESECFWEAHHKYIDIQFIASGAERIDYAPLSSLKIIDPYHEKNDRLKLAGVGSILLLKPSTFAILFPHDAHRPCMAPERAGMVRKIVIKVSVQ